jgi:hypothetical protein
MDPRRDRYGHGRRNAAVGEMPAFELHRLHQSRESAACANGYFQWTAGEYVRFAGIEIRGDNRGGNGQFFDLRTPKPLMNKLADAVLFWAILLCLLKPQKITHVDAPSKIAEVMKGYAIGVGRAK